MIQRICDICGKVVPDAPKYCVPAFTDSVEYLAEGRIKIIPNNGLDMEKVDLCDNCAMKIAKFIESMRDKKE